MELSERELLIAIKKYINRKEALNDTLMENKQIKGTFMEQNLAGKSVAYFEVRSIIEVWEEDNGLLE